MRQIGPVLEERLKLHNQTKQNNADPNVSIQVTRARSAVMDSTYWTVETIRTKAGIGDVAVAARRMRPYGRPDRIYEIHVDNGIVKTTIREYPDYQKDGWQPQFDLGAGSSVAIAFDGEWKLWRGKWRFQSDEKPWLFWTDSTNTLWVQHWDDATTKVELAMGVVEISALRAWKNRFVEEDDQGIIVAYTKADGYVYYRNYCQQKDGTRVWETQRQLSEFTGTAENINLALLNDFRMAFIVQDSLGNVHWYVTYRNWAGMALGFESFNNPPVITAMSMSQNIHTRPVHDEQPIETFNNPPTISSVSINMCTTDALETTLTHLSADVLDPHNFYIQFSHSFEIINMDDFMNNGIDIGYTVSGVTLTDGYMVVTTVEETEPSGFTFTINDGYFIKRFSPYCVLPLSYYGEFNLMSEVPEQFETFQNPPVITDVTMSQNIHTRPVHDEQPIETFNNPPTISSVTLTAYDVDGNVI